MRYEWDSSKEKVNIKKHGISFEDAKEALSCGLVVVLKEDSHSGEERYVYLGMCKKLNVLVVVVPILRKKLRGLFLLERPISGREDFMKNNYDFSKGAVIKGQIKSKIEVDSALHEQKTLTSIRLDNEIIEVAKQRAKEEGVGYLTWLNKKLRSAILGEKGLEDRVRKLERAVFKKKTV